MAGLDPIGTVAIVMLENRSFDHMVGYLSLIDPRIQIEGLIAPEGSPVDYRKVGAQLTNDEYLNITSSDGEFHYPFHRMDSPLAVDLPHDRHSVSEQLGTRLQDGSYSMDGFVNAFYGESQSAMKLADSMAFFTSVEVPMHDFFTRHFTICDHWFAPIPTDTQPNRLMSLSGFTLTDRTAGLAPDQRLVLDWLDENKISWRVYSDDISFFALFRNVWARMLITQHDRFRKFSQLAVDVGSAKEGEPFPKVIFIEPSFRDSPIHPDHDPNDNHPPLPVGFGEDFLRQVYQALTPARNLKLWDQLVMIFTYDEHGGFFDHLSPLRVPEDCGPNYEGFATTGVRVPAFVVSPFVAPGTVYRKNLDHTHILEFLAEWLTPGKPYSEHVAERLANAAFNDYNGRGRILEILDLKRKGIIPPEEPTDTITVTRAMPGKQVAHTANELAFEDAINGMLREHPKEVAEKYPGLIHWKNNS